MQKKMKVVNHYTTFHINKDFFGVIDRLDCVLSLQNFKEYKHRSHLQIYLRVPNNLEIGDAVYLFIEPQINLSKSIREGGPRFKLQLSIVKGSGRDSEYWLDLNSKGFNKWESDDLIHYLKVCDLWSERLFDMLADQPELFDHA